jgi:hypothetical protein
MEGQFPSDERLLDEEFQELRRTLYLSRDPRARLRAWREINSTWETAVTEWVVYARLMGASWAEIGEDLGITKQAAHARYHRHAEAASHRTPEELHEALTRAFAQGFPIPPATPT